MKTHKYTLEPYRGMTSRFTCPDPNCRGHKTFTRYIDRVTNEYIHFTVGRCGRSDNCGYHYKPNNYFSDNKYLFVPAKQTYNFNSKAILQPKEQEPSFIPFDVLKKALGKDLDTNCFISYLVNLFGNDAAKRLVSHYYISTSKTWSGATVFWQIDIERQIRSGKIMLYDPVTGKRDKTKNSWVHSALKLTNFNLKQCFFGEHLLSDKSKVVAIVESDKTAVIMHFCLPQYIWISSSGKEGLNAYKFEVLQGRTVILFPDLSKPDAKNNCFKLWSKRAQEFKTIANITVSDYLEKNTTDIEKAQGLDIADYFIMHNATHPFTERIFHESIIVNDHWDSTEMETSEPETPEPEDWNDEILELESYFKSVVLPIQSIKLNQCTTILDVSKFIESHLANVKTNNGKQKFVPYLNRLQELRTILS